MNNFLNSQKRDFLSRLIIDSITALKNEIIELRRRGPLIFTLINGRMIFEYSEDGNEEIINSKKYYYMFELEEEKIIPIGIPLKIKVGKNIFSAEVVEVNYNDIMILFHTFAGNEIPEAFLEFEPWIFYENLIIKLEALLSHLSTPESDMTYFNFDLLFDLMSKDENSIENILNKLKSIDDIPVGQSSAIQQANSNKILFVWGPPGTGKTETLAKIAINFLNKKKRVLILSTSNVAVDEAMLRIAKLIKSKNISLNNMLKDGRVIRYGYPAKTEILEHEELLIGQHIKYHLKHLDLQLKFEKLILELSYLTDVINNKKHSVSIDEEIRKINFSYKSKKEMLKNALISDYLNNANIIGTTLAKCVIDERINNQRYDVIIIDEISMVVLPYIIFASALSKEKFIGVGDFWQLPPIVLSNSIDDENFNIDLLQKDVFDYLGISNNIINNKYHNQVVLLNVQHRMHPQIAKFPNILLYKEKIKNSKEAILTTGKIIKEQPFENHALTFVDVGELPSICCKAVENKNSASRINILNAYISVILAIIAAKSKNIKNVGVITPYRLQAKLIRAILKDLLASYDANLLKDIKVATVHKFQGSECDVIIFDTVESYRMKYLGPMLTKDDSNYLKRFLNVAMTRAKGKFILVGNYKYLQDRIKRNSFFYQMIEYVKHYNYINSNDILQLLNRFQHPNLFFNSVSSSFSLFNDYLIDNNLTNSILCIPSYGSKNISEDNDLFKILNRNSGIKIILEDENDAEKLNKYSSKLYKNVYSWMPIFISNNSLIYGFPTTNSDYFSNVISFIHKSANNTIHMLNRYYLDNLISHSSIVNNNARINKSSEANKNDSIINLHLKLLNLLQDINSSDPSQLIERFTSDNIAKPFSFLNFLQKEESCPSCKEYKSLFIDVDLYNITTMKCEKCGFSGNIPQKVLKNYFDKFKPVCQKHNQPLYYKIFGNKIYIVCKNGCKMDLLEI